MTDKEFKAGLMVGAAGALVLAVVLSGTESSAKSDRYDRDDEHIEINVRDDNDDGIVFDYGDDDDHDLPMDSKTVDGMDAFNKVLVKGAMELDIQVGGSQRIDIQASESHIDSVEFSVEDGELVIDMPKRSRNFWRDADVSVVITVPELTGLQVDGAADTDVSGIDSDFFKLDIRGAGDFELSGRCEELEVDIRGAGSVDADELKCDDVTVELRGAGDVVVHANERVDARLAGVGNIEVKGKPSKVNKRVGGIGSIDVD